MRASLLRERRTILATSIALLCAATGCGGSDSTTFDYSTVAGQQAAGAAHFSTYCAQCHGNSGQGTALAPPLVGSTALPLNPPPGATLRTEQFHTALDVGKFVMTKMPKNNPGSLTSDEYLAILAFDLAANGITLEAPLTVESAAKIELHP